MSWTCPYCNRPQVVTSHNSQETTDVLRLRGGEYDLSFKLLGIQCLDADCQQVTLMLDLYGAKRDQHYGHVVLGKLKGHWRLLPQSSAKHQPDYIPAVIRSDYLEACAIRDLSPKASATLARRCLQGMIRDFCGISKARLIDEITALKAEIAENKAPAGVDAESIEAIDAVRKIGNIGAHMERDIGTIVDVEPGEAQALIELLELLFEDWYVARFQRKQRLERVKAIAGAKEEVKAVKGQQVAKK
jgi:hypothetical protein